MVGGGKKQMLRPAYPTDDEAVRGAPNAPDLRMTELRKVAGRGTGRCWFDPYWLGAVGWKSRAVEALRVWH